MVFFLCNCSMNPKKVLLGDVAQKVAKQFEVVKNLMCVF